MYSAPAVSYPVKRSHIHLLVLTSLWLMAALAWLVWVLEPRVPGWRHGLGMFALLCTGVYAGVDWWRSPVGQLCWDRSRWQWMEARRGGVPSDQPLVVDGSIAVKLDFQFLVLLRFVPQTGQSAPGISPFAMKWMWLERSWSRGHWVALRRALYARVVPLAAVGVEAEPILRSAAKGVDSP